MLGYRFDDATVLEKYLVINPRIYILYYHSYLESRNITRNVQCVESYTIIYTVQIFTALQIRMLQCLVVPLKDESCLLHYLIICYHFFLANRGSLGNITQFFCTCVANIIRNGLRCGNIIFGHNSCLNFYLGW